MPHIVIDGRPVNAAEKASVLEAALSNGIYIPHLCHHPDFEDTNDCGVCMVEIEGEDRPLPSCTLPAREGMVVSTKGEKADHLRKMSMELILAAHPEDCSTCPKYGRCELQTLIQYIGVSAARMRPRIKGFPANDKNPLLVHDMNRCVLCGRCVRACEELRGVKALGYNKREAEAYVGTLHDMLLKDSGCRFCGACAEVCPTGAIRDLLNYSPIEKRDTLIPCKAACPAHTDVPRYLRFVKAGKYAEAAAVIHERLPFPEILGNICARPCEKKCRRREVNEAVSIRNAKRYAAENECAELWKEKSKRLPATGKRVCVVGGGPAGLTAAFYLAKQGHAVVLKEARPKLGGQLQYGIPSYRLPREVVDREAAYAQEFGVEVELGARVERPVELLANFDAVLLAIGTGEGLRLPIPGNELPGTMLNSEFLRAVSEGAPTGIGRRVVVLGGGNVAFDCARSARRLGAEEVHLACLEARDNMLADIEEIEQAEEEGVRVHSGRTFERIVGEAVVAGMAFCKVKSFSFDENRRAIIEKEPGSEYVVEADTVIFAVGQRTAISEEAGLRLGRANSISVDLGKSARTSADGVFACGDATYGTKTVIDAVASGRAAASEIDLFLGGSGDIGETLAPLDVKVPFIGRIEGFAARPRAGETLTPAGERIRGFGLVSCGIDKSEIGAEVERCLQCDLRFDIAGQRIWSDYTKARSETESEVC
jgi:NADPH-dependent glutamate synthase beta subunit-like oxidoreductase/Pyruvate/2-oxoacid:ferredoxin oxidoreductase delta subunit